MHAIHSFEMSSTTTSSSLSDILWMMTYNKNCGFDNKHPRHVQGVKRSADMTWSQYEQQEEKRKIQIQKEKDKQVHLEKIQQVLIKRSKMVQSIKPKKKKNKTNKSKKKEKNKEDQKVCDGASIIINTNQSS